MPLKLDSIAQEIKNSEKILLTTHKQCDGDGLGSCIAMYHALRKVGKNVTIMTVDDIPSKYDFLNTQSIEVFTKPHTPLTDFDLTLIFDTNDPKLLEPMLEEILKKSKSIIFIDHHPALSYTVLQPKCYIDLEATSTGEIVYSLLELLNIRLDREIARSIYTSLIFDSVFFKHVKNHTKVHTICADLLKYEHNPEKIHSQLFDFSSFNQINFLSYVFSKTELHLGEKLAIFTVSIKDLETYKLSYNDVYDALDTLMKVSHIQCVAMIREEKDRSHKISLRSKNDLEVLSVAEHFKGGGHFFSSGATVFSSPHIIKSKIIELLRPRLEKNLNLETLQAASGHENKKS